MLKIFSDFFFSFGFLKIFIGVQLLYNIVLVSTVQHSESAIHIRISPLFWISFPFRSPQSTEQFPVLYSRFSLVIYCIHSINSVYMSISISQFIPPLPPWYPYVCSLCLCLYFCFVHKMIVYANFFRFHIYVLIYDICFSLSDLLQIGRAHV